MSSQNCLNPSCGCQRRPNPPSPPGQLEHPQRHAARGYSHSLLSPSIIDGPEDDREKYSFHSFLLCHRRLAEPAKIVRRARLEWGRRHEGG